MSIPTNRIVWTTCLALTGFVRGQERPTAPTTEAIAGYWYSGKAEIARFELMESRYGEQRKGDAILVFVTEPFSPTKQVKAESSESDAIQVLKLNTLKKFVTGIYDYSMMSSVFTPMNTTGSPRSLKLTASIQEWCGQVYQQLNLRKDSYRVRGHSYFEAEGDEQFELKAIPLEDEVWTLIRIAPHALPTGKTKMIPSVFDARLRHRRLAVRDVVASLRPVEQRETKGGKPVACWRYELRYPGMGRSLTIHFERAFPHRILSWREDLGKGRVTSARRPHTKQIAYWNHNGKAGEHLRRELGLRGRSAR